MPPAPVLQIGRIALNVADLDGACGFYTQALGFSRLPDRAGAAILRLGGQQIELRAAPVGRPYPEPRAANDPWFQHFAIAVSDMDAAYRRLSRHAQQPISEGGPQLLPPSTGSVTAYKFRDPDGHPLELSHIPGSAWLDDAGGGGPFAGIDHSALAVLDLDASIAFYVDVLGFSLGGRSLNQGPGQDRLDGLKDAVVDIVALHTADPGPHIELLHYRSPAPAAAVMVDGQDLAATQLMLRVEHIDAAKARLDAAVMAYHVEGQRIVASDPDGHRFELFAQDDDLC